MNRETAIRSLVNIPGAYIDTLKSGEQGDSLYGVMDGASEDLNPFGGGLELGPQFGNNDAYEGGKKVGHATAFAMNAVMTVSGITGTITAVQQLKNGIQLAQMVTSTGHVVTVINANGKAIVATAAALAQLGIGAGNVFSRTSDPEAGRGTHCKDGAKSWDEKHIMENHSDLGNTGKQRLAAGGKNAESVWEGLTKNPIMKRVKEAWKNRKRMETQVGADGQTRVRYRGSDPVSGETVEFWHNPGTGQVETAYRVSGGG